jgi:NAD(P)-dependent dehydrogenase (short-subunit alcohol dehydrogenase family)
MSDPIPTVSIVTGAGSGIGKAIAQRLAQHGPVVLAGRRPAPLREVASGLGDEGKDWLVVPTDISKGEDRTRLIDQTLATFGRIDVVVNNAAIGTCGELGTLGEPDIEQLIDINLTAPILLTRLALQHLQKTSGCVVSIGSRAAIDPFPGLGTYGCTKAGLEAMARAIRNEYPQIRAYTVHPGAVETEMLRSIVGAEDLPSDQVLVPDDIAVAVESFVLGERPEPSGAAVVVAKD